MKPVDSLNYNFLSQLPEKRTERLFKTHYLGKSMSHKPFAFLLAFFMALTSLTLPGIAHAAKKGKKAPHAKVKKHDSKKHSKKVAKHEKKSHKKVAKHMSKHKSETHKKVAKKSSKKGRSIASIKSSKKGHKKSRRTLPKEYGHL